MEFSAKLNPDNYDTPSTERKRRKIHHSHSSSSSCCTNQSPPPPPPSTTTTSTWNWKTPAQQQIYSSKLLQALRHSRNNKNNSPPEQKQAIREAANQALAIAAKGRTRWSRAILKKHNTKKKKRAEAAARFVKRSPSSSMNLKKSASLNLLMSKHKIPVFQRRINVLGRLVPGCRKLPTPAVLEEATDYIAALEMQVRAMTALAQLLSSAALAPSIHDQPLGSPS